MICSGTGFELYECVCDSFPGEKDWRKGEREESELKGPYLCALTRVLQGDASTPEPSGEASHANWVSDLLALNVRDIPTFSHSTEELNLLP